MTEKRGRAPKQGRVHQLFSLHGQNKDALAKTKLGAWEYDVIGPWYKCNMTDVMAGMGLEQYERYPSMLARCREETNKVIELMAERGIACNVHYKPLPMMTAYRQLGFDIADYPNAYALFENELTLLLNTRMSEVDVKYVIENFVEVLKA